MKRQKDFNKSVIKPVEIRDSRFGIRRLFLNSQERPRIGQYMNPGRGNWTTR